MDDLVRRHAEIYISTLMTLATIDVGEYTTATRLARWSLVQMLEALPASNRATQVHRLGMTLRTWQTWVAEVKEWKEEAAKRGEPLHTAPESDNIRFFILVMTLFQKVEGAWMTVGSITDRINDQLPEHQAFSYLTVQQRLDLYVGLGQLERHPENPNKYRSVLRDARMDPDESRMVEELLRFSLPTLYRLTFQNLAGSAAAGFRMTVYEIPEGKEEAFVACLKQEIRDLCNRMEDLERRYRAENPFSRVSNIVSFSIIGRDALARQPDPHLSNSAYQSNP